MAVTPGRRSSSLRSLGAAAVPDRSGVTRIAYIIGIGLILTVIGITDMIGSNGVNVSLMALLLRAALQAPGTVGR